MPQAGARGTLIRGVFPRLNRRKDPAENHRWKALGIERESWRVCRLIPPLSGATYGPLAEGFAGRGFLLPRPLGPGHDFQ